NEEHWSETLERVANTEHKCLALFYVEQPVSDPRHFHTTLLPEHGTLVRVHHASRSDGKLQFVAQGLGRVRVRGWLKRQRPPYLAEVDYPQSPADPRDEVKAYAMALINAIKELLPLNPLYSEELKDRKSTRLNSSHVKSSYAVFCLKKKITKKRSRDS